MVTDPLDEGINVALYTVPLVDAKLELTKLLRFPPVTEMSSTSKSVVASLVTKVRVKVLSLLVEPSLITTPAASALIVMVGAVPSYVQLNEFYAVLLFHA